MGGSLALTEGDCGEGSRLLLVDDDESPLGVVAAAAAASVISLTGTIGESMSVTGEIEETAAELASERLVDRVLSAGLRVRPAGPGRVRVADV